MGGLRWFIPGRRPPMVGVRPVLHPEEGLPGWVLHRFMPGRGPPMVGILPGMPPTLPWGVPSPVYTPPSQPPGYTMRTNSTKLAVMCTSVRAVLAGRLSLLGIVPKGVPKRLFLSVSVRNVGLIGDYGSFLTVLSVMLPFDLSRSWPAFPARKEDSRVMPD